MCHTPLVRTTDHADATRTKCPILARHGGIAWAVLHHTGRRSGKEYTTPVVAITIPDGFILPLPYGTDVDWLRNLLAAGRATIRNAGVLYEVSRPEITDADTALELVTPDIARSWRRWHIERYVRVAATPVGHPAGQRPRRALAE